MPDQPCKNRHRRFQISSGGAASLAHKPNASTSHGAPSLMQAAGIPALDAAPKISSLGRQPSGPLIQSWHICAITHAASSSLYSRRTFSIYARETTNRAASSFAFSGDSATYRFQPGSPSLGSAFLVGAGWRRQASSESVASTKISSSVRRPCALAIRRR
jgi:hypothetical protein